MKKREVKKNIRGDYFTSPAIFEFNRKAQRIAYLSIFAVLGEALFFIDLFKKHAAGFLVLF